MDCSICLEKFSQEQPNITLDCGHCFHIECLKKWIQTNTKIKRHTISILIKALRSIRRRISILKWTRMLTQNCSCKES